MEDFWNWVVAIVVLAVLAYNYPVPAILILIVIAAGHWHFKYQRPRNKQHEEEHCRLKDAYKREKALYNEATEITYPPAIQLNFSAAVPDWLRRELYNIATTIYEREFLRSIPPPPRNGYASAEWGRDVKRRTELNTTDGRN